MWGEGKNGKEIMKRNIMVGKRGTVKEKKNTKNNMEVSGPE